MRKFKPAQRLPHEWATMVVALRKYQRSLDSGDRSEYGQQALDRLVTLLDTHGSELREAIAIVSRAETEVNASRSQKINQYHRNRIGKLEKSIHQIDEALSDHGSNSVPDLTAMAELNDQRKNLAFELQDHGDKIDQRAHGVHLTKMRRKHR